MQPRRVLLPLLATFLSGSLWLVGQEERTYKPVSPEKIEAVLKGQKIDFQRTQDKKAGDFFYDFERQNFKIRLHNYGGKDLWIDAHFSDKIPLEILNGWNRQSKLSRCVQLGRDGKETISLEAQLDCLTGTSDGMIQQFLVRFESELQDFVKYLGHARKK